MKKRILTSFYNFFQLIAVFLLIGLHSSFGTAFVVSSAASGSATVGTFAWAIAQANLSAGPHSITFANALDGATLNGGAVFTTSITQPNVTIDATTMATYSCGNPRVMLSCDAFNGWQLTSSGSVIKGLRILGGIQLNGTGGHQVLSCLFNIDFSGVAFASSAKAAIRTNAAGTINNIIGGLSNCEKNVIASIGTYGIIFDNSGNGNQVLGNYIGTDITGLVALGSGFTTKALDIEAGSNHIFDGNTVGNVVGSSPGMAFMINGGTGHQIRNNNFGANINRLFVASLAIGTTISGSNAMYFNGSNGSNSVVTNNVIGNNPFITTAGIAGNVITVEGGANIQLINNYIGCDIAFNNGGSSWAGIYYYSSASNGTLTGNYIGYNGITSTQRSHGIAIFGCSGTFTISNNYIGVTPAGGNMGNGDAGMELNVNTAGSIFNINGNYIGFNRAMRAISPGSLTSESGGIRIISGQTVNISNNYIGTLSGGRANCGNLQMGIGIEGTTVTGITINNNVIAYNGRNAIQTYGNSSDKVTISQNCIFCNTNEGIELTNGTIGSPTAGIGNASYGRAFATVDGAKSTVQLSTGFPAWQCDFSGATWILRGYAPANDRVEIFQIHHCGCDGSNQTTTTSKVNGTQGLDYIATVTTDAQGRWTYSLPQNTVKNGFTITSTNIAAKRTSEFSPCVSVTTTCLPPLTATASGFGTGIGGAISGTSIAPCATTTYTATGSATFIRTSCYNNIYYTWLKNGTIVYGPSLIYVDKSVVNAADPADDGTYVLRVEDGNAASATCYLQSNNVVIDVVNCGLKLDILSFTGQVKGEFNRLQWIINADEYGLIELQSSEDAKKFSTIYSRSITNSLSDEFDHFNPSPKQYYRLKYTLSNGEFHYSNIVLLESTKGLNISVINTKVEETLNVQITSNIEAKINYAIYDIRGVIMNQSSMHISEGVSQKSIDVGYLSSALYLIRFEDPSTGKLIIQKFVR